MHRVTAWGSDFVYEMVQTQKSSPNFQTYALFSQYKIQTSSLAIFSSSGHLPGSSLLFISQYFIQNSIGFNQTCNLCFF